MKKIIFYLKIIFGKEGQIENIQDYKRMRAIALTAITALIAKLLAVITPLVTVRINLSYMGEEVYGLWSTVVSLFTMFSYADLGLGSGLQTELCRCCDNKTASKKLISSAYLILSLFCIVLLLGFCIVYPFINWANLVNAQSEQTIAIAGSVVLAIVIPIVLNVPFSLINRIELAYQEGYKYNIWQCVGNVINLVSIILISRTNLGPLAIVWASSLVSLLISILNTFVFFCFQKKDIKIRISFFDKKIAKKLLNVGIMFFVLSIFTTLSLSMDNFIVAKVQGLKEVTSYSTMFKIVCMIGVVSTMLSTPLWTANGEALEKGDIDWVKKTTDKMALLSFALSFAASLGVIILIKPALYILTDGVVKPDYLLLIGMCIYQIVVSVTNPYFMILNATRKIIFQIVNYLIFSLVSLPLKYIFGLKYGVQAITWIGVITYLLVLTISTYIMSQKALKAERLKHENKG